MANKKSFARKGNSQFTSKIYGSRLFILNAKNRNPDDEEALNQFQKV